VKLEPITRGIPDGPKLTLVTYYETMPLGSLHAFDPIHEGSIEGELKEDVVTFFQILTFFQ
jgi:hypothetical protein